MAKLKLSRAKWFGSKYFRKTSKDYREKSDGTIYGGIKKVGNKYVGTNKRGIESPRATPYGKNVRSKAQSEKDRRSFKVRPTRK